MDYSTQRVKMVDCQIRPNDVTDLAVIDAFLEVPREIFVPHSRKALAYTDVDIALSGEGDTPRYLMNVLPFAKIVQKAELSKTDVVLLIGCGCGYGAAVISKLVDSVVAVEMDGDLANQASEHLGDLGIDNVAVINGDHAKGYAKEGPFDVIVIEGAVETIPEPILAQLRDGGRLLTIVGKGLGAGLSRYVKRGDDVSHVKLGNNSAPVLPGFEVEEEFVF